MTALELEQFSKPELIAIILRLEERLNKLEAEVTILRKRNVELEAEVARLRKNSSNSSKVKQKGRESYRCTSLPPRPSRRQLEE